MAEERFNRHKQTGEFPVQVIGYCLGQAVLSLAGVDEISRTALTTLFGEIFSLDATGAWLYEEVFPSKRCSRKSTDAIRSSPPSAFIRSAIIRAVESARMSLRLTGCRISQLTITLYGTGQ